MTSWFVEAKSKVGFIVGDLTFLFLVWTRALDLQKQNKKSESSINLLPSMPAILRGNAFMECVRCKMLNVIRGTEATLTKMDGRENGENISRIAVLINFGHRYVTVVVRTNRKTDINRHTEKTMSMRT